MKADVTTGDVQTRVVQRITDLDAVVGQWDELVIQSRLPYMAPGWCIPWWEHVAPGAADLRIVLVYRSDTLIGVAPLYVDHLRFGVRRCGLLGSGTSPRVEPVCEPNDRRAVARAMTQVLASMRPRADVLTLDGSPHAREWCELLRANWPAEQRPKVTRSRSTVAPAVGSLEPAVDWLQTKSRNFRQQARRRRRHLLGQGMTFHLSSTPDQILDRLPAFQRLHEARFEYRGGSDVLDAQVLSMLSAAADQLDSTDRYRLWTIEGDEGVISAHLFVAAGGEVSYWLGGFDDRWANEQPSLQVLIAAVEHASERGDDRLDLGPGAQPYKLRLSDEEEHLDWMMMFPSGRRRPLAYAVTLGGPMLAAARQSVIDALPRSTKDRLKRTLRGRTSTNPAVGAAHPTG